MKATELMIGDYVKYQEHIYIVEEISAQGWVHLIYPDIRIRVNITSDYIMHLLEPIPLTKEILEKNGFTQCVTAPCGYYKAPNYDMFDILFHVSEDAYEDTWHTEVFTDHNDNNFVLYNLCYVHELQHILRVCNLNELANNLKLK
jgi:hypothetical protein